MKNKKVIILVVLIAVVIGSYIIAPFLVSEKNPSQRYSGTILGKEADMILSRVCFNCHSNETNWPWYTSLPVINVLIYSDVGEAREHLNFSNWESIPEDKRIFYLKMVLNEIAHDEMPPFIYRLGHPESKITKNELEILKNAAGSIGISFDPKISSD